MTYIDNLIVISPKMAKINILFGQLIKSIEIKNLGNIDEFLDIKITRNRSKRTLSLSQSHYIDKILARFNYKSKKTLKTAKIRSPIPIETKIEPLEGLANPKNVKTFQRHIGALNYLITKTKPDLVYPIGYLARFISNLGTITL